MFKFKVGDKVKTVGANIKAKEKHIGKVFTIKDLNPNGSNTFDVPHYGVEENNPYVWLETELELVVEEPTPEPIQVNVTININYDNACWYCRKGGLVDTYFAGKPGICPKCGRLCNEVKKPVTPFEEVVIWETPKVKENRPLTTEELEALPDGTRVFTVFNKCEGGRWIDEPDWDCQYTRWRVKKGNSLIWSGGRVEIKGNIECYRTYLTKPERPIPDEELLPF